jgi:hypothetical protein
MKVNSMLNKLTYTLVHLTEFVQVLWEYFFLPSKLKIVNLRREAKAPLGLFENLHLVDV